MSHSPHTQLTSYQWDTPLLAARNLPKRRRPALKVAEITAMLPVVMLVGRMLPPALVVVPLVVGLMPLQPQAKLSLEDGKLSLSFDKGALLFHISGGAVLGCTLEREKSGH